MGCRLYGAQSPACTHAYALRNATVAQLFVDAIGHDVDKPVDLSMIALLKAHHLPGYVMLPPPVSQLWRTDKRKVPPPRSPQPAIENACVGWPQARWWLGCAVFLLLWCMRFMRCYRPLHLLPVPVTLGAHTQGRTQYHTQQHAGHCALAHIAACGRVHPSTVALQEMAVCMHVGAATSSAEAVTGMRVCSTCGPTTPTPATSLLSV